MLLPGEPGVGVALRAAVQVAAFQLVFEVDDDGGAFVGELAVRFFSAFAVAFGAEAVEPDDIGRELQSGPGAPAPGVEVVIMFSCGR